MMKRLSVKEAYRLMQSMEAYYIIDVREPYEYYMRHLPGSINIPLATIDEKTMASYAFTTPLFVYCEKGTRSAIAANKLILLGFIEVYDMGGIQDMF